MKAAPCDVTKKNKGSQGLEIKGHVQVPLRTGFVKNHSVESVTRFLLRGHNNTYLLRVVETRQ